MSTAVSKVELKKNGSLLLGDQEEGTSSMTSSYDDEGVAPLDKEIACKVRHLATLQFNFFTFPSYCIALAAFLFSIQCFAFTANFAYVANGWEVQVKFILRAFSLGDQL